MKKFLGFFDNYLLKIGVSFLIAFVALYPKLPSVHITHTWVYIRLEDFSIAIVVGIWLIQILRRKVKLPIELGLPFAAYWIFGFLSLALSLIFIAPTISNFYPSVAFLSFARRIEYMILFFVAFSTIRSIKDVKDYLVILSLTAFGFILYALGQRFYLNLWTAFPAFFNKYQFCFPSFQTGNEEFAKGIPLCLPKDARITSTFAGHYDLGAYLVMVIPIFTSLTLVIKRNSYKIAMGILTILSMVVITLTASRISFIAYIIATIIALISINKKKVIIPFVVLSMLILVLFSGSTAKRFLQTFRLASVVTNSQGQIVGEALSPELQKKLETDKGILANIPTQSLPEGSGFIGLPQVKKQTTNTAVIKSNLTTEEAKRLSLENGGVEISTISGNFLVQKAFVYDISFTTRFQAEWPNAIKAFEKDPIFGSGFATITLATDNDFLRFLGETGILGLASFLLIFMLFKITFKSVSKEIKDPLIFAFIYGFAAGAIGLFINGGLIDVFESSKVAETLWILSGIAVGAAVLYKKNKIDYKGELKRILTLPVFIWGYVIFLFVSVFISSIGNFFAADDFTWLKWAATSNLSDLGRNFVDAQGFFYRPLDKAIMFFLNTFFAFKPEGYHFFILTMHLAIGLGVYLISMKVFKKFTPAIIASLIFLFLPSQSENIFWISTFSVTLSAMFIVYGILFFMKYREGNYFFYLLSFISSILAFLSYEMGVVLLPLIILSDVVLRKEKISKKLLIPYLPFAALEALYLYVRTHANVVQISGNYSYSVSHLIPNFIGNFVGYFGLYAIGERFFPIYDMARSVLRAYPVEFVLAITVVLVIMIGLIFKGRSALLKASRNQTVGIIIFAILFTVISLLPFLGLGNIAQRYGYLGSIGYAFILTIIILAVRDLIFKHIKGNQRNSSIILGIILLLIGAFYFKSINDVRAEWEGAGKITQRTLSFFRIYYDGIPSRSNIYIANLPIKEKQAWVFPLGVNDGLWFIYRDETLNIKNFPTLEDAKRAKKNLSTSEQKNTYLFYFDRDKKIQKGQ